MSDQTIPLSNYYVKKAHESDSNAHSNIIDAHNSSNDAHSNVISNHNSNANAHSNIISTHNSDTNAHSAIRNAISDVSSQYDYQITASKYNVEIDTSVNINVKVTDKLGNAIKNTNFTIYKNNESWKSGTTNNNGELVVNNNINIPYTANTWGLTTFSIGNISTQIYTTGVRHISGGSQINAYESENSVEVFIYSEPYKYNGGTTWQVLNQDANFFTSEQLPNKFVVVPNLSHPTDSQLRYNTEYNRFEYSIPDGHSYSVAGHMHWIKKKQN